jgi:RecJ-like exonuclease
MKRRAFITGLAVAAAAASCARMDKRDPRYNPSECPFCHGFASAPGVCSYCAGSKKCSFCGGTGTRKTGTPPIIEENIPKNSYSEPCPYCKEKPGVCRYCQGTGKCWACDGTGKVTSWDFFDKYMKLTGKKQ